MDSHELYYLIMVLAAFTTFAVALASSYLKYTAWKNQHPQTGD